MSTGRLPRSLAITGLGTFVGGRVAERALDAPVPPRVVGLDLEIPRSLEGRLPFHRVDLTAPTADSQIAEVLGKKRCDVVLHAAFLTNPQPDCEYAHELEVIGSLHVMNAAAAAGVRKLVVMSSAEVYGPHPDNPNFLSEEHPLRSHPHAHAVQDRVEMEGLLRVFAQRHPEMVVTVLRPCWVMGPSQFSPVTRHFESKRVTTLMGFDPLMQFLHEEDLLGAIELALTRDAPGPFNLAGDGALPLSTLIRLAGKRTLPIPHPLLFRLGYLESMRRAGDSPEAFYDYLRYLWVLDTARAGSELGFQPEYTTKEAWMSLVVSHRLRRYR